MSNETKLIIITSDEDLIRRISSTNNDKTRIIDLDDDLSKDDHSMALSYLAELSPLNCQNNAFYRQALQIDNSSSNRTKKLGKRSLEMRCLICGDKAIGFNYDVLSCASCKAFFRRNAQSEIKINRCLNGNGICSIEHSNLRKCPFCRLEKCFRVGMRKDFLLTNDEKERRRKRSDIISIKQDDHQTQLSQIQIDRNKSTNVVDNSIEDSQRTSDCDQLKAFDDIDQFLVEMENQFDQDEHFLTNDAFIEQFIDEQLFIEQNLSLENVRTRFIQTFTRPDLSCSSAEINDKDSAISSWSNSANLLSMKMIQFFRQNEHFEQFDNDDRFLLIKRNLLPIFPLLKCYFYRNDHEFLLKWEQLTEKHQRFIFSNEQSFDIRANFNRLISSLIKTTKQDPTFLSLLMIILLFSPGFTILLEDQTFFNDSLSIYRAQTYYIELLNNYLSRSYDQYQASTIFIEILRIIFEMQRATSRFGDILRSKFLSEKSVDRLAPLVQTLLQISR